MSITNLTSLNQFRTLTSNRNQISIIDFTATWCGPCRIVAPKFAELAKEFSPRVTFFKCDVDAAQEVAQHFKIAAMPTFVILKGSTEVEQLKGANLPALEALVRKHAPAAGAEASGSGSAVEKGLEGFTFLNEIIDSTQLSCLNEEAEHTVRDLLKGGGGKYLTSDSDAELLIHIPLNQTARIRALKFTTLESKLPHAPKKIKIYVNRPTIGFGEVESEEPTQEIELTEAQAKGTESVMLRFVRFQKVSCISIFVAENQGDDDQTRIDKLELFGNALDGTDVSQLKKGEDDHEH